VSVHQFGRKSTARVFIKSQLSVTGTDRTRQKSNCSVWTASHTQKTITSLQIPHNFSACSCFLKPPPPQFPVSAQNESHHKRRHCSAQPLMCSPANCAFSHTRTASPSIASRRSEAAPGCPKRRRLSTFRDTIKGTVALRLLTPQSIHHSPHPRLPSPLPQH